MVAGLHGFSRAETRRRAAASAEQMGLGERPRLSITYSLGMKKRLALAMALVHEPKVLILDEPTTAWTRARARDARDHRPPGATGRTVFLSTHFLEAAERLCHRVAIIRRGVLQAVGAPAELRRVTPPRRRQPGRPLPAGHRG